MEAHSSRAAVWGAVAGSTAGAPMNGRPPFVRVRFYEPVPTQMASSSALDAWALYASLRLPTGAPASLTDVFLRHLSVPDEAAAFGLANARDGFRSPFSGSTQNPLTDDAGAMARAAYWGLVSPGDPERAAEWAFFDAGFDHAGPGRDAAVAIARTLASVRPGDSAVVVARTLIGALPTESPLHRAVPTVLGFNRTPDGPREAALTIAQAVGAARLRTAEYAFAAILLGIVAGEGDFGRTVCNAVGMGGGAETAGLVAGALCAAAAGSLDPMWAEPLGTAFVTGPTFREVTPPAQIEDLAASIDGLARSTARTVSAPAPATPTPTSEVPVEPGEPVAETAETDADVTPDDETPTTEPATEPAHVSVAEPALPRFLAPADDANVTVLGTLTVSVRYLDPPVLAQPGRSVPFTVELAADPSRETAVEVVAPEGVEVAFRSGNYRAAPEPTVVPGVARLREGAEPGSGPTLRVDDANVRLAWPPAETWAVVGPLPNIEGTGFDHVYAPETDFSRDRVFAGRNGFAARWEAVSFAGTFYDLEPRFMGGPGVLYMRALLALPGGGSYRLVAAASTGVVAWVDGVRLLRSHDQHRPVARPVAPYLAEFESPGESIVMLKVLRNLVPLEPLVMYVLAEDGSVVRPRVTLAP